MSFVINSKWAIFWVLWAAGTNYWAKGGGLQEPLMCWQAAQTLWQPGGLIACGWSGEWACEVEPFISGIWWYHMVSEVSAEHPTSDPNPAGMGAFSCVLVTDMFFVGCDRREEKRCVLLRLMSAVERREEWRRKAFFFPIVPDVICLPWDGMTLSPRSFHSQHFLSSPCTFRPLKLSFCWYL